MIQISAQRILRVFCLLCAAIVPVSLLSQTGTPTPTDKGTVVPADKGKAIVGRAIDSYYSLHRKGLAEFKCVVQPDWDGLYSSIKADEVAREQLLPLLKATQFRLLVGPDGASTVSHDSDVPPPAEAVAARLRQSIAGVDQILTGFLHTWSGFVINVILPEPGGEYELQEVPGGYLLRYGQGTEIRITVKLSNDLRVTEFSAITPEFRGDVLPTFTDKEGTFLLDGYKATYEAAGSKASQNLSVNLIYQEVTGFMLPSKLNAAVETPGGPLHVVLTFTDCTAKSK